MTGVVEHPTTQAEGDSGTIEGSASGQHSTVDRGWRPVHLLWIAAALVGVSLLSLWAGTRIKSPAQAAADAAPPTPSVITAPVVAQQLTEQLGVRGTVVLDGVDIVASSPDSVPVVTDIRVGEGDHVTSGYVPIVVSGRPVIVLAGQLPGYRDLVPGMVGPDVAQLQTALDGLGYSTSEPDQTGTFGLATQELVSQLYADLGFEPVLTSPDAFLILANANRAVEGAEDNLALARSQQSAAQTSQERNVARIAVAQAERALEAAEEEASLAARQHGVKLPLSEVVFVPDGGASVLESNADVGRQVPDGTVLMTLGAGSPKVRAELAESQRSTITDGTAVEIRVPSGETILEGRVEAVEQQPAQDPSREPIYVAWITTSEPIPEELVGREVQILVTTNTTTGEVLTVPVTAVSGHEDGTTTVSAWRDGAPTRVEVEVGLSAGGYVEIIPTEPDTLNEGDQVVLGIQAGG